MGDETLLERIFSGDEEPKDLPLALLQSITNDFSDDRKIGQGGFGAVYKGELQNGIIVAVKRIEVNQITIDDVSFRREFNSLMNTNHQNVVRFLGFCSNTHHTSRKEAGEINLVSVRERLLCFEYIRNGSLDKHITDELRGLEWEPRYAIISGICKGLFYLHEEKKIVHMDLKPPNILLDDHMVPKITDFGLSRSNEMSHTTGQRFGTPGYVAPEYEKDGKTSFKCDIYSLGVIITELVTGRKSVPHKNNVLRRWRHRWNKPPTLLQYRQVTRCIEISVRCRQQESGHRPSILEIVNILGESESMDGHTGQESAYLDDDMLRIEPLELKLNEEMSWSVKLTNKTKASFAFNIERPSQQYTIWPDKGIVTPGCNEYLVQITLQPQQRAPQVTQNADKIIFQSTKVPEGLRDEDITENIFHEEAGKVVDEVDLMIVYEPTKPKENCKSREDTNMPAEEVPEAKRRKIVESAFGKGKLGSSEKAEAASMETETETLKGNLLRVKQRITDGERNGLIPTEEAEDWVQRAEQAISEEADNRESFDQRCRIFGCSLNCRGNYKTSKKASEKVDAVRKYISSTPLPDNVTRTPPPPPVVDLSTHSVQLPPSRERILKNALMCIKEDVAVGVIGIWGQDRDEKTHLLKKINDSFLGECPFDFVIFVTASNELSVQAQIISRLCTDTVPDVATQATRISELLKKKSFLLLVDDLRVQLDLEAVGIPHPLGDVEAVQRKVVVTSISQSICHLMDVERYIQVPDLEEHETRQLFAEEYGQQDPYSDPGIGALAEQLVRELKGLPSDLIRYGKVMQGIRDVRRWEDAIDAVRKANLQRDDPLNLAEKIVRNLENATKDLDAKGNDVRREIVDAERQQRTPTNEVNRWLQKVDNIIRDVQVISHDCRQLKKDVTMEASEKLHGVQECLSSCPSTVAIESMPPPVQEMPGPSMSAENRNLQDALQYIKDDPKVGMIGIWGPGGVGKTHLLNNINNSFGDGMTFDFVIFVTASRGCSVEKVQSQIIQRLRLQSTDSNRLTIHEYMKTKSFLVLLDDLWDEINLKDVGIPYPLGNVKKLNRKVVLTTRLRKVCGQMKVKKELNVTYLEEHEAWQLFEENIGAETLSSPHIEALARELMKELKGLPLALITIGKAMYRKDEYQWETAIQYMQQSCCADDKDPVELGMETNVFKQLKFSYDNLRNETLKHCFLTCALWPEDMNISRVDLAQCWMGLGLVNEHDIESSFRKSYSLIADLTAACLLEGCEYHGIESNFENSDGSVKVHDVIRDMALWISRDSGENNDKWIVAAQPVGRDEKVTLSNKAEYISLMSNRIPIRFNLDPTELRILCLRNNEFDESIIGEAIKNCSSLTYLDLSGNNLKRIPEELCSLVKLEYLDLSRNEFGETEVPHSFGKLINLKFLYLMHSGYVRIPAGVISSLKALRVIDLRSDIIGFACNRSLHKVWLLGRELGTLPQLKALGILVRDLAQFESLGEAANLPIRYLTLKDLGALIHILSTDFAQRTLHELDIIDGNTQQITVEHDTEQPNNHFGALNKLSLGLMRSLREIKWMGATPAFIFPRLTCLELFDCTRLSHLSWVMYLPRLEQLYISYCSGMVQAFMRCHGDKLCNGQDKTKTFPCLKILSLSLNHSLETIGDKGMEFPSLERLVLVGIPLKRLPFQLDSLPLKLKELWFDRAQCWERLECEEGVKSFLQPALKFGW